MRYTYYREDFPHDDDPLKPDFFIWKVNIQTGDIYIYQWPSYDILNEGGKTPDYRWMITDDDARLKLYLANEYTPGKFKKISEKEAFLDIL